jgi:FtsH-binding integral membrane protein
MVDIEKIEKRTVQSFYDDGLTEISLGLIFLLLGGYFFAQAAAPEGSALSSALSVLFVLVIVSAGFLVSRILRFLKRRITYPRTGYIAFKKKEPSSKRRAATMIVGGIIGASFATLYGLSPSFKALFPALNGLLFAVAVLLIAGKIGLARFYILSAASAVIGLAVTAAGVGDIKGISLYYGLFGAAVTLSGLAALVVYLRKSPRVDRENPDAI